MENVWGDTLLSVALGLGLAAAAGLRVFLPLLLLGGAARLGWIPVTAGFDWIASDPGLLLLATATAAEIGAYYVPWLDNLLDGVAAPSAIVAGVLAMAAVAVELPTPVRWTMAVIAGGGTAGVVQTLTTVARLKSSVVTGGLGNPVLSTLEWIGSLVVSLVAIFLPMGTIVVLIGLVLLARWLGRRAFGKTKASPLVS